MYSNSMRWLRVDIHWIALHLHVRMYVCMCICKSPPPCHFTLIVNIALYTILYCICTYIPCWIYLAVLWRLWYWAGSAEVFQWVLWDLLQTPHCPQEVNRLASKAVPPQLVGLPRFPWSWWEGGAPGPQSADKETHIVHPNMHTQDVSTTGCPLLHLKSAGMSNFLSTSQRYTDILTVPVLHIMCVYVY